MTDSQYVKKAEHFLLDSIRKGLAHSFDCKSNTWVKPYPEVTGYLLSYFSRYKQIPKKIISAAHTLLSLQHESGGFRSFYDKNLLFTFDTGQIMKGFIDLYAATKENVYLTGAKKCADFILKMQVADGSIFPIFDLNKKSKIVYRPLSNGENWGSIFSYIQLKNIEVLALIYTLTKDDRYQIAIHKLVNWGKKHHDHRFTHPFAYYLEGMWMAGEHEFVTSLLKKYIVGRISKKGFISYSSNLDYAYVSGSIQLAILLYKANLKEHSHSILEWARKVQNNHKSGGLFQYAYEDAAMCDIIHSEINTWGTKYYCELEYLWS